MKKVFLYLYPIKEYTDIFFYQDDRLYDEWKEPRPLPILNNTIDQRYRQKGYQVVFALYPDRELYGIDKRNEDKIIYTDITFSEASIYDENYNENKNLIPKYPDERILIEQLGCVDELVVGGYHAVECVIRVAEYALQRGISTLVDLDLSDFFFNVYKQNDYFDIENYSPEKFKMNMISRLGDEYTEFEEKFRGEKNLFI